MMFTERFNKLLREHQVGKSEVVPAAGISKSAYYRYVAGEGEPTMTALTALADYFNVSTDYLLGRTDNPVMNR